MHRRRKYIRLFKLLPLDSSSRTLVLKMYGQHSAKLKVEVQQPNVEDLSATQPKVEDVSATQPKVEGLS